MFLELFGCCWDLPHSVSIHFIIFLSFLLSLFNLLLYLISFLSFHPLKFAIFAVEDLIVRMVKLWAISIFFSSLTSRWITVRKCKYFYVGELWITSFVNAELLWNQWNAYIVWRREKWNEKKKKLKWNMIKWMKNDKLFSGNSCIYRICLRFFLRLCNGSGSVCVRTLSWIIFKHDFNNFWMNAETTGAMIITLTWTKRLNKLWKRRRK